MPGDLTIRAADRDGNVLSPLPGAKIGALTLALGKPPSLEAEIHLDHARSFAVTPGAEVHAWREGSTVPVFMGVPWIASKPKGSRLLRPTIQGVETYFMRRFIVADLDYAAVEQHQIGWNLIAHTQAETGGDLNISAASWTPSGVTRDRSYRTHRIETVYEALDAFRSILNGFDWSIEPTAADAREWTPYYPSRGTSHPEWSCEAGPGTRGNIIDYGYSVSMADVVTRGYVSGQGSGSARLIGSYADPGLGTTRDLVEGHRSGSTSMTEQTTADDYAQAMVEARRDPVVIVDEIDVSGPSDLVENVRPGDTIPVKISDGWIQVDATYRVVAASWPPTWNRVTLTVEPT